MKIAIIIPAYNEASFISLTLKSLLDQTSPVYQILVVDDNSTDATAQIVNDFAQNHPQIQLISKKGQITEHLPGSKIVEAFNFGLNYIPNDVEVLCKFDADLIFPSNYLEKLANTFKKDPKIGMVGGFCSIEKNGDWVIENLTNKDHIRGALKAYRKACFEDIKGLKPAMGWDTIDEILAQYHGWKIQTIDGLLVKHLKPTGHIYSSKAKYKQGGAFYSMRYGLLLTIIASGKLAWRKQIPGLFADYIKGYLRAKSQKKPFLINEQEGKYVRNLRWRKIREKLF